MGKSGNCLYFGNYCSLMSQSWLKHFPSKIIKLCEHQKVEAIPRPWPKTCFSQKLLCHLKPKFKRKLIREWE